MSFKTMRILFISFLISFSAQSQWFEASGQAYINNNDTKLARNKAIESALKKTLLVAGASVSSVQQVVNGLLTKDEVNIKASGIVNSFEIVNENHTDNIIEVVIRADIFPQEKQCYSTDYQKSLLLTQSHILHREQANIGSIYQLDTEVIQGLAGHLKKQTRYINTNLSLKSKTEFSRLNNSGQQNKIKDLSMSLANISDNQFILYSEISDISLLPSENKSWAFWQNQYKNRNFDITVYLYDGINGELVFEKKYQSTSEWSFDDREKINTATETFWTSNYGLKIDSVLKDITLDIDEALMCQPSQAKIIRIENNELLINLGKRHGVNVGDEFSLLNNATFTLPQGKSYSGFYVSPYKVKVISANRDSAIVVASNDEQLGNIQINDIAVRH